MENENHTKDWRELIGKLDRGDINSLSEEDKQVAKITIKSNNTQKTLAFYKVS